MSRFAVGRINAVPSLSDCLVCVVLVVAMCDRPKSVLGGRLCRCAAV
jgi:hypothetical protein